METIKIQGVNEEIYKTISNDGLLIYIWKNPYAKSFNLTLNVKYGSIHTEFNIGNNKYQVPDGIAHFMEHIKFNVKKDVTANDLFDPLGSDINAFTTFKYTSYIVNGVNKLEDNLNNLLDYVYNPYFTKEMIDKEKGIIASEINMGYDQPYNRLYFEFNKSIYKKEKYRNLISGEVRDIKKVGLKDIKLIYDTFYHPKNMFLIVTGDVNPYEIEAIVNNNLKKKKFIAYKNPIIEEVKEPRGVNEAYKEVNANVEVAKAKVGLKIPKKDFGNIENIKLNIILSIILNSNFGDTSDLKEELLQDNLITYLGFSRYVMKEYVILDITVESKFIDEAIKRIKLALDNLVMDEDTLKRKVNSSIATLVTNFDSSEQVNTMIQNHLIYYDEVVPNVKEIYEAITMEEVKNVIKKINTKEMAVIKMDKNTNE